MTYEELLEQSRRNKNTQQVLTDILLDMPSREIQMLSQSLDVFEKDGMKVFVIRNSIKDQLFISDGRRWIVEDKRSRKERRKNLKI